MKAISLYSGAGGMDVGFIRAGFDVAWANDVDSDACDTYRNNIGNHIWQGDIGVLDSTSHLLPKKPDLIFGGPPCQGFSVAGKMNPDDPRSKHIWTFCEFVKELAPTAFVMENVKALGVLARWVPLREELLAKLRSYGYMVNIMLLNASLFDVPQSRERVFIVGIKGSPHALPDFQSMMQTYARTPPTVRETLLGLDRAGTGNNSGIAKARITITPNPVLRKSPYAGMLFNGLGRPVRLDGYCSTLPATMGGNKTPIVDEESLRTGKRQWVEEYHAKLMSGEPPLPCQEAPNRLRRLTTQEAALLQTFPKDFVFSGSQSSIFRQIGNAVPCNLSYAVASMVRDLCQPEKATSLQQSAQMLLAI